MSQTNPSSPGPPPEETLFAAALKRPPAERAALLEAACRGDASLRARLEALLAAHDLPDALPELPDEIARPEASAVPAEDEKLIGRRIGRYVLQEIIGEGGCGVVYAAEQTEPVRRRVALKLIKPGMNSKAVIARFEAERQALALMDHPNIAKVLDGGTTETGLPYFVMELVRGVKITEHCDQHRLNTAARLKLFIQVCQAVQHAHQKGIIHRDLKPSNVSVTMHDGVAVPKVIDFGIAKAIGSEQLTDKTVYTALDQFIGTPAYMSPEQAERRNHAIDARTDIYSLGVLLYELLTGRPPFDTNALLESGFEHMLKIIREQEPPKPSTCLSTLDLAALTSVAHVRGLEPPRLLHLIRGDLDWISVKCLEKDRARRYDSADALANDLRRHLQHEPIAARSPSLGYRTRKSIQRHRVAFVIAGAVIMGIIGGILVGKWDVLTGALDGKRVKLQKASAVNVPGPVPTVTNFVVNAGDSGPGSLREVVGNAASGRCIAFAPGLSGRKIRLTNGQILLTNDLTLDGSALRDGVQIDGNHNSRIFQVSQNVSVVLTALTITNGSETNEGAGIYNEGKLNLVRCTLAGNISQAGGGAIATKGKNACLVLDNCTLTENRANYGAAVFSENGELTLNQATIAGNTGIQGTGGLILAAGRATLQNSIVAGNTNRLQIDPDIGGSGTKLVLAGHNFIGWTAGQYRLRPGSPNAQGQFVGSAAKPLDLRLAPLGRHGGPTVTMPPLSGSLLIDGGSDAAGNIGDTDQRGFPRRAGSQVDIGAVEFGSPAPSPAGPVPTEWSVTSANDQGAGSLRETVARAKAGDQIQFDATLSGQTLILTNGQIRLDKNLTIDGSALAGGIFLDGDHQSRIFQIGLNVFVVLDSLTITNGFSESDGGGIDNLGALTLRNSTIVGNSAKSGGGIYNYYGTLTMNHSTVAHNRAANLGGGIFNARSAMLSSCTVAENYADNNGGGVCNDGGTLNLTNTIVAQNTRDNVFGSISSSVNNLVGGNARLAPLGQNGGPTLTMPPLPGSPAIDAGSDSATGALFADQRGFPRKLGAHVDIGAAEFNGTSSPTPSPTPPIHFVVTTTNDDGPGSLRDAIRLCGVGGRIEFAPALSGKSILLTSGEIHLEKDITIDAAALRRGFCIDGNGSSGVFYVDDATVWLDSLTITNGAIDGSGRGGGIYSLGALTLNRCSVVGNYAAFGGGIFQESGTLVLSNCLVAGNTAVDGGGVYCSNNSGKCRLLQIWNSTVANNSATNGDGGGIRSYLGMVHAVNCTIVGNYARGGGGGAENYSGKMEFNNCIVADNRAEQMIEPSRKRPSLNQNIWGAFAGTNILIEGYAGLAPLGDHGGPTLTMPPLADSPAIDAGDDSAIGGLSTDQRGWPRKTGRHVDLGAVEAQ